jgi:hypothetical protein
MVILGWKEKINVFLKRLTALSMLVLGGSTTGLSSEISVLQMFNTHCVKCHGKNVKVKGDVNLHKLKSLADLAGNIALLHVVIEALEKADMPPEDEPELNPEVREASVSKLRGILKSALAKNGTFPRTPIRRMNRFQYNNAVKDLFALNVEVFSLPEKMMRRYDYFDPELGKMPDTVQVGSRPLGKSQMIEPRLAGVVPFPQDLRAEHGFDNRGDHLSLSPIQMEAFIKASQSIVNSDDFTANSCGIWNEFFSEPKEHGSDRDRVIRERLANFLRRAFRRSVTSELVGRYAKNVQSQIANGESFMQSMKNVASAVLCSPRFLYLCDRPINEVQDDFNLASRLSFFLWGSIPDEELLELAESRMLHEPKVLAAQVDRMLRDKRLKRFCDSFPAQWMQLERIISSKPDQNLFPIFYSNAYRFSMHMMLEPLLLFETVLVENLPVFQLIDSDFSYRSKSLSEWYKTGDRKGDLPPTILTFKRELLADRREGGVITNAAVMTMTSNPTRSQPITRGAWILTVIFNNPPEPPPADVPPLPERGDIKGDESLTIRERLATHRNRSDCSGCHVKIDPLGFALENYGPVGKWRETYRNGRNVDPSGVLCRKHKFQTIYEFKDALLAEKPRFVKAFSAHLLSFALGRKLTVADSSALETIAAAAKKNDYCFQSLLKSIILSEPFLHESN